MAKAPAAVTIDVQTLIKVESWSRCGLDTGTISTLLGLTHKQFIALASKDARIYESMDYGRASGIEIVAKALYALAASGKDVSALKFYLERLGGDTWRRPTAAAPQVIIQATHAQIDVDDLQRRWDRQRALQHGAADDDPLMIEAKPPTKH